MSAFFFCVNKKSKCELSKRSCLRCEYARLFTVTLQQTHIQGFVDKLNINLRYKKHGESLRERRALQLEALAQSSQNVLLEKFLPSKFSWQ
jgi:hypothetical protein